VKKDEFAGWAAKILHPGDRLLPSVAALVEVDGAADPSHLVRNGPMVGFKTEPGTPSLNAERLERPQTGVPRARLDQRRDDAGGAIASDDQVSSVRPWPIHPPHEATARDGDGAAG
jgi:hypothetical protein